MGRADRARDLPAPDPDAAAPAAPARWSTWRVLLFLVPLFFYYAYPLGVWPLQVGANESAHAYLAMALHERGETCVDAEVRDYFFNHDLVTRRGRYFSNKAPGPAFLLVPVAAVIDLCTTGRVELVPLLYFGRVFMLTLPFLLFLFLLGRALERMVSPATAWGLTLAYALGSSAAAYAVLYFGHNFAAAALVTALILAQRDGLGWRGLAGVLAGFAVLCEFQVAVMALVVTLVACFGSGKRFHWRGVAAFGAGALAMAAVLMVYNRAGGGGAATVAYQAEFEQVQLGSKGSLGFSAPSLTKVLALFFSPAVGLFLFSPWLLAAIPGVVLAFRRGTPRRRLVAAAAAAVGVLVLLIASHDYWIGGAIAGPRYLAAGLPFLLFLIAAWIASVSRRWRAVIATGLVATTVPAVLIFGLLLVTAPMVNTDAEHLLQNPITGFAWPLLTGGHGMFTVARYLGAGLTASTVLFGALLLAVIAGYAVPWLLAARGRARVRALGGALLGVLVFAGWTQLGECDTAFAERNLKQARVDFEVDRFRDAEGRVRFIRRAAAFAPVPITFEPERRDPGFDAAISRTARLARVADGFKCLLAALWHPDGYLILSDAQNNTLYAYEPGGKLRVLRDDVGYHGRKTMRLRLPGASGIVLDGEGRLVIAEHGRRRVSRVEPDGQGTVLVERCGDKRFNSPSSLALAPDGAIWFIDPPFGLPYFHEDHRRETKYCGIYRIADGKVTLENRSLYAPVGLAFSKDGQSLFAGDLGREQKTVYRFPILPDGSLGMRQTFFAMPKPPLAYPTNGLVLDEAGHVFATGNAGVWVLAPTGRPLGFFRLRFPVTSLAWGGPDRQTLYICAGTELYRLR